MANRDIFVSRGQKLGHLVETPAETSAHNPQEAGDSQGGNSQIDETLETSHEHLDVK